MGLFTWKRRWCVLKHSSLSFFDSEASSQLPAAARKVITLSSICKIVKLPQEVPPPKPPKQ